MALNPEDNPVVLATAGYDHTIRMWDALKSTCIRTIPFTDSQVNRMALSSDKHYLAVAGNPRVSLYDVFGTSESPVMSLEGHKANVTAVEFSQDYKYLATASEDKTIRWWDVYAGSCKRVLENNAMVNDVAVHPDMRTDILVSCDQKGLVRVWGWLRQEVLAQAQPSGDTAMRCVAVFVFRLTVEGSAPRQVELEPYINFDAHEGARITKIAFSASGALLATASSDRTARLWQLAERVVQAPDGSEAVVAGAELINTLAYHQRWVWDVAFSSDSGYLVTVSTDTKAALWDVASGEIIREFKGHQKGVVCVALNDAT
ncbi:WD40 repeat-like protein [Linderina pennispora]|uniref:WD40 repeat-like protein n=1 Tax=Linderina pennispora TaxID=61395 RepID=A0A1Y1WJ81_9FUNG|nr:WD40 repeat-like protein [Linderina pennispora]ORX73597.1 WD40 repeat-like protein [Linderina pennispora]